MAENTASAKADETKASGRKQTASSDEPTDPSFNMDELRELMDLVNEQGFTDFEFENENIRVRLSKIAVASATQPIQSFGPAAGTSTLTSASGAQPTETDAPSAQSGEDLHKITSPIVGTFYRSPGQDKEFYVKEGSRVSPDTVVCIVEAMKLMNEIQAEISGEVVKIYVENGQPVEFGQPLFGIRK